MIKLSDLLKENFDLIDKLESWLDTGDFSSNEEISDNVANYLEENGYDGNGTIYRVLFLSNDEFPIGDSKFLKDFILRSDNKKYKSFCKNYSGVKYIIDNYSEFEDHTIIFKQNSNYFDLLEWFEDNIDKIDLENDIFGEIENTQEVVAKVNSSLQIVKII
tara:strand:+ start:65 stop:547 length:483 start_codon:yes stop_codon:yes gene_type:complete